MNTIRETFEPFFGATIKKVVLSKPRSKSGEFKKVSIVQRVDYFQIEKLTEKQVFHQNVSCAEAFEFCITSLQESFMQMNAWDEFYEHQVLISKQGKVSYKKIATRSTTVPTAEHNRAKEYILSEGMEIPPLVDMGIFTKEGIVVRAMYDKFRQINRFIEIVDDAFKGQEIKHLNIIDFGCGKSYLTFILYHYFTVVKKISVNMIGLDLKEAVIEKCNTAAKKYGYDNLRFELGDINGYKCDFPVDMVISLHACDTATDYALYNAIKWKAKIVFSVPCCQHELNAQIKSDELSILTRYGIIQERVAALMTDAIRGNLLEAHGYKTQILEFVDFESTPKNILIRATLRPITQAQKKKALQEVTSIMEKFSLKPKLYELLMGEENNS